MQGPRDNGCHLMEMHVFGIMAVTVDLQGVSTIYTRVEFGRGGPLSACNIWVSPCYLKVIARAKFHKFK